ncbi:MAG: hypothetical protein EZS26_003301 [Candidatus Ordinivivax streblomastigis]|uniref:DUF4861 domain-containing protein n=1 Tax=Candidatus Ordinivivax streblomastigis TaxID=2540710 RepID=A0A5M8NYD1_9BACT|nr:MAG: hypothetical protein EZS26_003301 [Candidatus Ordinivivax streblomastigis]
MKKIFNLCLIAFIVWSCGEGAVTTVKVGNASLYARVDEIIEVSLDDVSNKLDLKKGDRFIVTDSAGVETPYQITYNGKIIFPVNVAAQNEAIYVIKKGILVEPVARAYGRQYPERVDDIAWENDLVVFRTYGPALQATGEKAFGYDIWVKNTKELVVEARYGKELNPETVAKIRELSQTDPHAADNLRRETSYHLDHGDGMDCYKVGPTLGGGTTALLTEGGIVYPYCYRSYEILDNGPLRFTMKLVYNPLTVNENENVVETRVITLDAGSYLNKTEVSYAGLDGLVSVATGIVLHESGNEIFSDTDNGFMTYVDPTEDVNNDNGKIFIGAVFPEQVNEIHPVLFSPDEKKERGAEGHLLAISNYTGGKNYTYYWGGAWSKADIKDSDAWNQYVWEFAEKVRKPCTISLP